MNENTQHDDTVHELIEDFEGSKEQRVQLVKSNNYSLKHYSGSKVKIGSHSAPNDLQLSMIGDMTPVQQSCQ